jgi:serine/threonine-protein kinase
VQRGSTVTYWVSSGPGKVEVPDLSGMSAADAAEALDQVGLEVGATTQDYSDTIPAGAVIGQDPPAGREVERGTEVDLVLSMGASPTPTPTPTLTQVPPVMSMLEGDAVAALEAAGFAVVVQYAPGPQAAGTVIDQDPPGESEAEVGSTVTITVDED